MSVDPDLERAAARKLAARLAKRGALTVPTHCPFVQTSVQEIRRRLMLDQLQGCDHRANELRGATVVATYGENPFAALCIPCFGQLPQLTSCQVCLRAPAPGLRTVVHLDPPSATLMVGRLCRDCRPGRVA